MKLTKKQINRIKGLREEGLKVSEIAEKLDLNYSTVHYHLNSEKRKQDTRRYWNKLPKEKQRQIRKRYNPYQKEYQRNKYQKDKNFRKKKIEYSKKYYQEHRSSKPIEEVKGGNNK